MANEQRSEPPQSPFWSTLNQGAAVADEALGGLPSAMAGLVNPLVAPVVNPFLPEGSKIEPSFSGIKGKQQEAFKEAPEDWQNLAKMPHPGNMAGLADDAARSMLVFALPAMRRLQKAGMLPSTGPRSPEALEQIPRYPTSRTEDDIRREWDLGFARTGDFWGSSPERRIHGDDLLMYVPSQDFRLKDPIPDGYLTDGKVQDLFHMTPEMRAAMPPGMAETNAYLRPVPGMSIADSDGSINYTFPHLMDPRTRANVKDWPPQDGRVFSDSKMNVTTSPGAIEDITAHEFLGHGPQMTEVGSPYIKASQAAKNKRLKEPDTPASEALVKDYNRLFEMDDGMNPTSDLRREMDAINTKLRYSEDLTNYHDMPQERWARWVQAQHGMSLDDVRANPPGLNDDFFTTGFGDMQARKLTGRPFREHAPFRSADD